MSTVKRVRHKASELNYEAENYYSYNEIEQNTNEQDILHYLDLLPPIGKQVFNLFAIEGYSHKEIGEMLGFSENTSKWHVKESRKKLKLMLENKTIKTT